MLEGVTSGMSELLTNDIEVVNTSYISNPSLGSQQWLLVGGKEVRVSNSSLRLWRWLLVGVEEVRVSNPLFETMAIVDDESERSVLTFLRT